MADSRLSKRSIAILSMIAEGHSYSQIVDGHGGFCYRDIFHAAEEALRLNAINAYAARCKGRPEQSA